MIEDAWTSLRELTAARIALGRAGHSLPTRELLAFQLAHARARDAVHRELDPTGTVRPLADARGSASGSVAGELRSEPRPSGSRFGVSTQTRTPWVLHSAAHDRTEYLRRPDLGRKLNADSGATLVRGDWDAVIILADGLSATAVDRHASPLVDALLPLLDGWRIAPLCIALQARVAIADEIGEKIGAALSLILIGERPGLSSPDSLGAYLTWSPRAGRTDAERNCVSNIRPEGLDPALAAHRIATLMHAARDRQLTGVELSSTVKFIE